MTRYFVLVYDRTARRLVRCDEFSDSAVATAEYDQAEAQHGGDVEVVLVGADSMDTLKQTHGQYFAEGLHQRAAGSTGWTGVASAALAR